MIRWLLALLLLSPRVPPDDMTDGQFGPYLQNLTSTSIVVCWRTSTKSSSKVAVAGVTYSNPTPVQYHQVPITGLSPNTAYAYTCSSTANGATVFTGSGAFRTGVTGNTPYTFVAVGENHDEDEVATFQEEILAANPLFMLDASDQVDEGTDIREWDRFFTIGKEFFAKVPLFCAMGNHTYSPKKHTRTYRSVMNQPGNEEWYTFRQGNAQFIVLNSTWYYSPIKLATSQVSWLVSTLQAATDGVDDPKWIVAMMHIPPYSSGPWYREIPERKWVRKFLMSKLEQYGVDLVIAGHDKFNEHSKKGNVHFAQFATGLLSPKIQTTNPYKVWMDKDHRALGVCEVGADKITVRFVGNDGTVLHQFDVTE